MYSINYKPDIHSDMSNRNTPLINVVAYVRVSSSGQLDGVNFTSLDAQEARIREFAAANAMNIVAIYSDQKSAKDNHRPALQQMLSRIAQGGIDCVLSYRMDRISRQDDGYRELNKFFKKHGVKEIFTNDANFDDGTADGRFMKGIYLLGASYEREKTAKRVSDKNMEAVKAGLFPNGIPPVGYIRDKETKELLKDPQAKAHIELIFKLALDGKTPSEISKATAAQGFVAPIKYENEKGRVGGSLYTADKILKMLRNPVYAGCVYRTKDSGEKEIFDAKHEGYVSKADWENLQTSLIKRDAPIQIRIRNAYPLKGILFCTCSKRMSINATGSVRADGSSYFYYACNQKKHFRTLSTCKNSIPANILEEVFFSTLVYMSKSDISLKALKASKDNYRQKLETELDELNKEHLRQKKCVERYLKELTQLEIGTALESIIRDNMNKAAKLVDSTMLAKKKLEEELAALDLEIDIESIDLKSAFANFEDIQSDLTASEKAEIAQSTIKKVTLTFKGQKAKKKLYHMEIVPTDAYMEHLGIVNVDFSSDNSGGRAAWSITSPFSLESKNYKSNSAQKADSKSRQKHQLHSIIKMHDEFAASPMTQEDFAQKHNLKRGILGRRFQMLNRLSPNAIDFVLKLRAESDISKLTFNKLDKISHQAKNTQLKTLKSLLNP